MLELRTIIGCLVVMSVVWELSLSSVPSVPSDDFQSAYGRRIMQLAKVAEMHAYRNTDIDPCDDFYSYACYNWEKINPADLVDVKTQPFTMLEKGYDRKVLKLLSAPKADSDSKMERNVKNFFESCLNKEEVRHNYKEKLLSVMEEFGGMPALKGQQWQADKFDWLDVVARILRKYGKQILLTVDILPDLANNEINRIIIGQLDELVSADASGYYKILYESQVMELQRVLELREEQARPLAARLVNFKRALAEGIADPNEGLGMEDKTRLRSFEEMTESYKPVMNFTRFSQIWLGSEYKMPVYEYVETYLVNLRRLLLNRPPETVANYIMWELLQDFRLEAEKTDAEQQRKCVNITKRHFIKYLDHMVYKQLIQHHKGAIDELQTVWSQLKHAFEERLQSNAVDWLSEGTRDKALEKLSAISLEINSYEQEDFDQQYGDLTISTEHYFENVINILELRGRNYRLKLHEQPKLDQEDLHFSPAYKIQFNKVVIPVPYLQPRYLWDDVYPAALKYATLGTVMAHELAHGFDDIGRKYDAKGNLNSWWDRSSAEAFALRKACLRKKYGASGYRDTNVQDENIADNAGIRIAYLAYEKWLSQYQNETTLPSMNNTPEQLFFIAFAQMWCTGEHRFLRPILYSSDDHPPEEVRVRATLSNFEKFAETFECGVGTEMNPREKCVIY